MPDLVDPFHLPHHQFRIADHLECLDLILIRISKSRQESLILSIVIGMVPKIFTQLSHRMPRCILNGNPVTGRSGISPSSAVDISKVCGGRRVRNREKTARIRRAKRQGHRPEFTMPRGGRGGASIFPWPAAWPTAAAN